MNNKNMTTKLFYIMVLVSIAIAGFPTSSVQAVDIVEVFTSSGSWTAPFGVTSIKVEVWGAGGAGGGDRSSNGTGGGGGGGGAYARINNFTVIPGTSYSFVVGTGGIGSTGNEGGNGGASWFIDATTLHANGGSGGYYGNGGTGGTGGAAGATGDVKFKGGDGATSSTADWGGGGGGSGGSASAGNNGSGTSGATAVTNGGPGGDGNNSTGVIPLTGPGGGGGGGGSTTSSDDAGGNGYDGQIRITYVNDETPPTVVFDLQNGSDSGSSTNDDLTKASTLIVDAIFDEPISGFTDEDLSNIGTATDCAFSIGTPTGNTYPVTVSSCLEGTLVIRLRNNAVTDGFNYNIQQDGPIVTIDRTGPIATIDLQSASDSGKWNSDDLTNTLSQIFDVEFNEPVTAFTSGDMSNVGTATGCSFSRGSATGNTFPVTVSSCSEGTLIVSIHNNGLVDSAGNLNNQIDGPPITLDRSVPYVTNITSSLTNGTYYDNQLIPIQVTFSENLDLTGNPKLAIATGNPASTAVAFTSQTSSNTLTFNFTTIYGNYSSDLDYFGNGSFDKNGAVIKDYAGNSASVYLPTPGNPGSLSFNKNIVIHIPALGVDDSATVSEDSTATTINVLSNDTDGDIGSKKVTGVTQPDNGTVLITNAGDDLTYEPDPDYCNDGTPTDDFTYTLSPGGHTANVMVTVTCVDDNPVANDDWFSVSESTDAISIDVLSNDTDVDDGPIVIHSASQPANGTVVLASDQLSLTYEPNTFYCNDGITTDDFAYNLQPGGSTAYVHITVTCIPDPTITTIAPNNGSIDGGTSLVITGTNFSGSGNQVTLVKFGADEYTIVTTTPLNKGECRTTDSTHISCKTDAHAADIVDVEVTTKGGITTKTDGYQFVPYPIITSVSINIGSTAGGTPVLVTGQHFKSESGAAITWTTSLVTFGGNEADCTINSPTQIACDTPPHPAGTVDIAAKNPGGIGTGDDLFTFVVPYFQGVTPNSGPTTGGTEVVLFGSEFRDATQVTFGGVVADCEHDIYFDKNVNADVTSDTTIFCETPAHNAGLVDVVIWDETTELHHLTESFTYIPVIANVNPSSGPTAGGYQVTITGTDFTGATSVKFGGVEVASYTVVNDAKVTAILAPHTPGLVNVSVTSPGGGTQVFTDAFAFIPPNVEADVYPNFGPDTGGVKVTITGPDLSDATNVLFGGVDAGEIKVWGDDTVYAYAPPHAIGLVDVTVVTPDGSIVYPGAFTYTSDGVPYVTISYPTVDNWLILVEDSATKVRISFSNPMNEDPKTGPDWEHSVLNPDNYLLIRAGKNKTFETNSCAEGVGGDDLKIKINQIASYNPSTNSYIFWLNDGYALNPVEYHLFVCGTTSVKDAAGTKLNAGLMDTMLSFYVTQPLVATTPDTMPSTGFAPSRVTALPPQTTSYDELGDLWIEIPRLGLEIPIVGVPQLLDGTWDVTWLGDQAGWLNGTAFPSYNGNSVITGHVFTDKGVPGPFQSLYELLVGDNIYVHVYGERYYYVVQEILKVSPHDVGELLSHKDSPWLTLMTCLTWNEATQNYDYHLLIRAQAYGW